MRIKQIKLCNFGSYEGENTITINNCERRNIILIGGKNGAGKTTLFDAVKLCLYGAKAFGYQVMSFAYKKHIQSLLNDFSKQHENAITYVSLDIELTSGQNIDFYSLKRTWQNTDYFESFRVVKNNVVLTSDEIEDFTSFLLNILPPELFNLFFFDGEQIAEHFLSDEENQGLKKAFLTLCGYDNFSTILDQLRRTVKIKKTNDTVSKYLETKDSYGAIKKRSDELIAKMDDCKKETIDVLAQINHLDKEYSKRGGITEEEWNTKLKVLREQESLRGALNSEIKKLANEEIPLIILKDSIPKLKEQIYLEDSEVLDKKTLEQIKVQFPGLVKKAVHDTGLSLTENQINNLNLSILNLLELNERKEGSRALLHLSMTDRDALMQIIKHVQELTSDNIVNNRLRVKESINYSKKIRQELTSCNIDYIKYYQENRTTLLSREENLKQALEELSLSFEQTLIPLEERRIEFNKASKELNDELKQNSVLDLSSKVVLFLEDLISTLVKAKKQQVEEAFLTKINQLKQKDLFISRVSIDDNFFIHAYKVSEDGYEQEVDKTRLSKGEKQVFIMALYWALMTLSRMEIPFMIDTPFARIDSRHREMITVHFFKELKGQVFIFSTDEEICGKNLSILDERIGTKLLLENKDNKKTTITNNKYFED